jgi:hypothetical protein
MVTNSSDTSAYRRFRGSSTGSGLAAWWCDGGIASGVWRAGGAGGDILPKERRRLTLEVEDDEQARVLVRG